MNLARFGGHWKNMQQKEQKGSLAPLHYGMW
jgi:hypothetical protein